MPRSKHRRKGKARQRAAFRSGPTVEDPVLAALLADAAAGRAFDDPAFEDPGMTEALAQAEEELIGDLTLADLDDSLDTFDPEDEAEFEAALAPLLQTVEEQVRTNRPPEVAATLARLVAAGHARDEAVALIGTVLMFEFNDMMRDDRDFDSARYARNLAALPRLPDFG